MKDNRTYSLTAKERKAKREGKKLADETKEPVTQAEIRAEQEKAMVASQKRSRHTAIITGAIIGAAVLCILVAMLVPVITYLVNPYHGYDDVIARFRLSNGMTLEYVIDEKTYDTAATNFIFLATNGFFDNTVFFDAQKNADGKGWLRFGGYESQPAGSSGSDYNTSHHRSDNKEYVESFKALPNSSFPDNIMIKFKYELNADNNGTKPSILAPIGILTYMHLDSSTEFQFACSEGAPEEMNVRNSTGTTSTSKIECTMVGYPLNDKTIENILAIRETRVTESTVTSGFMWTPPSPDIRIEKVKVYNLDGAKWNNFNFIDYVKEEGRLASWGI